MSWLASRTLDIPLKFRNDFSLPIDMDRPKTSFRNKLDLATLQRTGELSTIRDQLLKDDPQARLQCFYWYPFANSYCGKTCENHDDVGDHRKKVSKARKILLQEGADVGSRDFLLVLRTFYCCTDHDITTRIDLRNDLKGKWNAASKKFKNELWGAIRDSGRDICPRLPSIEVNHRRPPPIHDSSAPPKLIHGNRTEHMVSPGIGSLPLPDPDTPCRPSTRQGTSSNRTGSSKSTEDATSLEAKTSDETASSISMTTTLPALPKFVFSAGRFPASMSPQELDDAHQNAGPNPNTIKCQETLLSALDRLTLSNVSLVSLDRIGALINTTREALTPVCPPIADTNTTKSRTIFDVIEARAKEVRADPVAEIAKPSTKRPDQEVDPEMTSEPPVEVPAEPPIEVPAEPPIGIPDRICESDKIPSNRIDSQPSLTPPSNPLTQAKQCVSDASPRMNKNRHLKACKFDDHPPAVTATEFRAILRKNIIGKPEIGHICIMTAPKFFEGFTAAVFSMDG
jgi:hypothetical protein